MNTRLVVSVMVLFCVVSWGYALPRFAARTGYRCQSCHEDPSGGALRQLVGVQYGREQLPVPEWSKDQDLGDVSNILGNAVGVGADFRMLYFSERASSTTTEGFWEMQGDLYLNFRLTKKISLFLNKGLYNGFEAFALIKGLPANSTVKAGKFLPNYGTRIDDHTTYIRTYTGFSPEFGRPELTGLELAVSPGPVTATGGFYNSADGFGAATTNRKAYLGRMEVVASPTEVVHVTVGTNVFGNATLQVPTPLPAGTSSTVWGAFGSVGIGDLALLGETDWIQTKTGTRITKALASYVEADYPLIAGVDLKLAYDFYDPDIALTTGSMMRYSAGVEFFPLPGVEVRPVYRLVRGDAATLRSELHALLHLYF